MKKRVFKIPISDNEIYINGIKLVDYVKVYFPGIYEAENNRVNIIYSTSILHSTPAEEEVRKKRLKEHDILTKKYADSIGVPLYIYAIGNEKKAREVVTGVEVTANYEAALGIRKISDKFELPKDYNCFVMRFLDNVREKNRITKHEYSFEEYEKSDDLRLKVRMILGSLKYNVSLDSNKKIPMVENDLRLDYTLMLIVNYGLSIDDFKAICTLRANNQNVFIGNKSELFNEIDKTLLHYGIIKKIENPEVQQSTLRILSLFKKQNKKTNGCDNR